MLMDVVQTEVRTGTPRSAGSTDVYFSADIETDGSIPGIYSMSFSLASSSARLFFCAATFASAVAIALS